MVLTGTFPSRCFVGLAPSHDTKRKILEATSALRSSAPGVKWAAESNYHLTLRFLGQAQKEESERLEDMLEKLSAAWPAFRVVFGGAGAFPVRERAAVIWLGVKEGTEALAALASAIEEAARKAGFVRESRPFNPHLTLGRLERGDQSTFQAASRLLENIRWEERFDRLVFFRSISAPQGVTYIPARTFFLMKK